MSVKMRLLEDVGNIIEIDYKYSFIPSFQRSSFKTKCLYPIPNSVWQFEVTFADSYHNNSFQRQNILEYQNSWGNPNNLIEVRLLSKNKNEPRTIKIGGVVSINGVPFWMQTSSIPFYLEYEDLINDKVFVFQRLYNEERYNRNVGHLPLQLECRMYIWGLHPPLPTPPSVEEDIVCCYGLEPVPVEEDTCGYSLECFCSAPSHRLLIDLKRLYSDSIAADVVFTIDGQNIKAHKAILSARSPVFRSMFESEMLESRINCIPIVDCDIIVFKKFLRYLYTGEFEELGTDVLIPLYETADKYFMTDLLIACVERICSSLSVDNVVNVFMCAHLHNDAEMKVAAKDFILKNFLKIVCHSTWFELLNSNSELVKDIISNIACKEI